MSKVNVKLSIQEEIPKIHLLLAEDELLKSIGETWDYFYAEILPTIQFVLHGITVRLFAIWNVLFKST